MTDNILNRIEEFIKRRALAELIGTPASYLSTVAKKRDEDIPEAFRERILEATAEILGEVEEILEGEG